MTTEKLINEFNSALTIASRQQRKREEKLKLFHNQIKKKEQNILKKMNKASNKSSHKQLKKELVIVKKAYAMLAA